jgi:hypothetical protein
MRETIGSTWIFMLIISFTLIFAGFLVLALSYSKVYKMKNELTSIIEKYEGLTPESEQIINDYLTNSNYRTTGYCKVGSYASDTLMTISKVTDDKKQYYYCIDTRLNKQGKTVFTVTMFYDFNLPIFGQLMKYNIKGETYGIKNSVISI